MYSRVASSSSSRLRHGPCRSTSSVLYRPFTVSASALSYESPLLPTEPDPPASADADAAHQPLRRAAGHPMALAVQLLPDLAGPVDLVVRVVDLDDQRDQLLVPPGPRRRLTALDLVVGRRRDLHTGLAQHAADRFDTAEHFPMLVDELDYFGSRGSN